jgi:hypothetical protein
MTADRKTGVTKAMTGLVLTTVLLLPAMAPGQEAFDSPEAAMDALKAAVRANDKEALQGIFGPQVEDLRSGDPVQDAADVRDFGWRLKTAARLEPAGDDRMTVLVGLEEHPFAVPIVRKDGKWSFDTAAGKEELLNRRIGQNELGAISVCRAFVVAQREYYLEGAAGTDVPEYAQRLMSSPGARDGLYWETKADEPPSPLGPLVAQAQAEGYSREASKPGQQPQPYHGYVYRILTRQGESAPGGKMDYVINGHMVAGFAFVACPVNYGSSGVMTFLVSTNGRIYQKDLGEKTAELAQEIAEYDPDNSWTSVED